MRLPLLIALLILPIPARLQESPAPRKPVFSTLFPRPTGTNGYEEIVQAGDQALAIPAINQALDAGYTLTDKRSLLRQPAVINTLQILRVGLAKPLRPPDGNEVTDESFQAFAGIRQLARLLSVQQYVLFADGKVAEAIHSAGDALRLG